VLAQTVERRMSSDSNASQGRFDRWRTARMAVYGTFICGPLLSGWYVTLHHLGEAISVTYRPIVGGWLGRLTPFGHLHKEASGTLSPLQLLLAKVTADGLLFQAPFLNLYFATMGALEGLSPSAIFDKCIEKFHRAWALSIVVWTPVQLINLWYVPHSLQPVFVAAVNVGWKTVLSLLNSSHAAAATAVPTLDATANEAAVGQLAAVELQHEVARLWAENEELRERLAAAQEERSHRRWWHVY